MDAVVPGDVVSICGTVKAINAELSGGRATNPKKSLYLLYITANSVSCRGKGNETSSTSTGDDVVTEQLDTMQFSTNDMKAINAIASEPNLFKVLVNSLCPKILGQEIVKAGLILSLFGGTVQDDNKLRNAISVRGDTHVLVVGGKHFSRPPSRSHLFGNL